MNGKRNTLTPIYKGKGNPDEEGNYRGVSVAGTLAKMYGSILGNRLRNYIITYNLRARSQAGGRPKQGVHQHHFTIQHLKDLYKAVKHLSARVVEQHPSSCVLSILRKVSITLTETLSGSD